MNNAQKGFSIAGLIIMNGLACAAISMAYSGEAAALSLLLCNSIAALSGFFSCIAEW